MALGKEAKAGVMFAVEAANRAPVVAKGPCGGCGRAYVVLTGSKDVVNAVAAACKKVGLMFLRKAYGVSGPAIYMGYDNADGRALGKAEAFAAELNRWNVRCYTDAVAD